MLFLASLCLLQQSRDGKLSTTEQGITVFMVWDARLGLPVKVSLVLSFPFLCHAMLGRERVPFSRRCVTEEKGSEVDLSKPDCIKSNLDLVSKFSPIQTSVIERFGLECRKVIGFVFLRNAISLKKTRATFLSNQK